MTKGDWQRISIIDNLFKCGQSAIPIPAFLYLERFTANFYLFFKGVA